jgi:hypothetical protein
MNSSAAARIPQHLPALDGVRGLAIVLVLCHNFQILEAPSGLVGRVFELAFDLGWIGVQLFFVLSGFLITGILLDTQDSPAYYRNFFVRRVLRIFPLYYGVLLIAFVLVPLLAAVPAGYVPDTGFKFAAQAGLSFGWNVDHTDVTRDREGNSNQLLDTLCQFHQGGLWELALPNGTYSVLVSVGDARLASTYTLVVEGVTYWRERVIGANQFLSNTSNVSVADGRLTLSQDSAGELATRINYVEVSAP